MLNFANAEPVRSRFGFTDDDLDTITSWVRESGVRWGFDQRHRAPYGLDEFLQNTWRFGIDRVLSGVAMSDDSRAWIGTTLPLDDVGSNRVELAGRLAEFVDRLSARWKRCRESGRWPTGSMRCATASRNLTRRRRRRRLAGRTTASVSSPACWPRRTSVPKFRCGSAIFGRCSVITWPAGRRG